MVMVDLGPAEAAGQVEVPALVTVIVEAEAAGRVTGKVTVEVEPAGQVEVPALVTVTVDALAEPKAEAVRITVEAEPVGHVAGD